MISGPAFSDEYYEALRDPADRRRFRRLQLFRLVIAYAVVAFLALVVDFGIDSKLLFAASAGGITLAGLFLRRRTSFLRVSIWHLLILGAGWLVLNLSNVAVTSPEGADASMDFAVPLIADRLLVIVVCYLFSFLTSWWFWTSSGAATFEALLYSAAFVWMLAGHRNYHLDAPKQISSQTWKSTLLQSMHVEPQHLFIALGGMFLCLLTIYFYLASNRPLFGTVRELKSLGVRRVLTAPLIPLLLLGGLVYYSKTLNDRYSQDLSRASEGVGEAAKEGKSNLGFHKAVGQTNQPAALVRLEGDYAQNPWAPMLYFREGALSEYNGHELVVAAVQYDTDVPRLQPGQPYVGLSQDGADLREKVVQSVYLLMQHNAPFAVDYPSRIATIKNPDPERFQLAYQAISQAPAVKVSDLIGQGVGDPRWDSAALAHYLRAPGSLASNVPADLPTESPEKIPDDRGEDLRYLALSRELTGGLSDPLARSERIINFLSEQSVYTRDPGHQVGPDDDPVAPYLFGPPMKKRGYCVHFAHAGVYMLRLAGIPARIGTGYLTDLQYAKDGHILLQMGDRHAWPEIYVDGLGWTIVDVNPAQAENEQAPVPDAKLLEELMGKINPTEELIAPPEIAEDKPKGPTVIEKIFDSRVLGPAAGSVVLLLLLLKAWLRWGYRLASDEKRRVRLAYAAFASELSDLGIQRRYGETRKEFRDRLNSALGIDAARITSLNESTAYRPDAPSAGKEEIRSALGDWQRSYAARHWRAKRVLAFFNPRSFLRWFSW